MLGSSYTSKPQIIAHSTYLHEYIAIHMYIVYVNNPRLCHKLDIHVIEPARETALCTQNTPIHITVCISSTV